MKKFLFVLAILALGLTACNKVELQETPEQTLAEAPLRVQPFLRSRAHQSGNGWLLYLCEPSPPAARGRLSATTSYGNRPGSRRRVGVRIAQGLLFSQGETTSIAPLAYLYLCHRHLRKALPRQFIRILWDPVSGPACRIYVFRRKHFFVFLPAEQGCRHRPEP